VVLEISWRRPRCFCGDMSIVKRVLQLLAAMLGKSFFYHVFQLPERPPSSLCKLARPAQGGFKIFIYWAYVILSYYLAISLHKIKDNMLLYFIDVHVIYNVESHYEYCHAFLQGVLCHEQCSAIL
jgi:hypothetical protein